MIEEQHIGDAGEMFTPSDEQRPTRVASLNLTVLSSVPTTGPVIEKSGRKPAVYSFQGFRAQLRLQSPTTSARLARLARGATKAIQSGARDRYARARWLELAVAEIAEARPSDANAQAMQRYLTRLLRQTFKSMDWRRALIAGLRRTSA